jgi:hypothetical protein
MRSRDNRKRVLHFANRVARQGDLAREAGYNQEVARYQPLKANENKRDHQNSP